MPELGLLEAYTDINNLLKRGIAYHHAGMLPILREYVELCFQARLVKVRAGSAFSSGPKQVKCVKRVHLQREKQCAEISRGVWAIRLGLLKSVGVSAAPPPL